MSNVFHYREEIKSKSGLITCRVEFPTETYWFGWIGGYEAICHVCAAELKRSELLDHLTACHPYVVDNINIREPRSVGKESYFVPSLKLNDIFEMDKPIESVADLKSWDQKELFEHYVIITKMHMAKLATIRDTDVQIALQGKIDWMLDEMKLAYFNK